MANDLLLIDRHAIAAELRPAFDEPTTLVMLDVLERVAAQVHAAGVTREDFSELKAIVERMEAVQERTILELAELRATTAELTRGQAELRESVVELRASIVELRETTAELTRGQAELRESVVELRASIVELRETTAELTRGQAEMRLSIDRMAKQLGGLSIISAPS